MEDAVSSSYAVRPPRLRLVVGDPYDAYVGDDRREADALRKLAIALVEALAELPATSPLRLPLRRLLVALRAHERRRPPRS